MKRTDWTSKPQQLTQECREPIFPGKIHTTIISPFSRNGSAGDCDLRGCSVSVTIWLLRGREVLCDTWVCSLSRLPSTASNNLKLLCLAPPRSASPSPQFSLRWIRVPKEVFIKPLRSVNGHFFNIAGWLQSSSTHHITALSPALLHFPASYLEYNTFHNLTNNTLISSNGN